MFPEQTSLLYIMHHFITTSICRQPFNHYISWKRQQSNQTFPRVRILNLDKQHFWDRTASLEYNQDHAFVDQPRVVVFGIDRMGKGAERAPVELMPPHMLALKQHRAHNFSAGAAMFDTNVMAHLQNNFLSYDGSGMGLFVSPKNIASDSLPCGWERWLVPFWCGAQHALQNAGNEPKGSWRACTELHRSGGSQPQNASWYSWQLQGPLLPGISKTEAWSLLILPQICAQPLKTISFTAGGSPRTVCCNTHESFW